MRFAIVSLVDCNFVAVKPCCPHGFLPFSMTLRAPNRIPRTPITSISLLLS
jgi:hypothetical protein